MAKTKAQYQRDFREKAKLKFKKIECLLPIEVFNQLDRDCKKLQTTKVKYLSALIMDNPVEDD